MLSGQFTNNVHGREGHQTLIAAAELALQAGNACELNVQYHKHAIFHFPFVLLHPALQIQFGISIQVTLEQLMKKALLHMRKLLR
ncbi:hypothetical protein D3C75_888450 [compost metagenome]